MATALDLERAVVDFRNIDTVDFKVRDAVANAKRLDVRISEIHGIDIDDGGRTADVIREMVEDTIRSSKFMRLLADMTCNRRALLKEHMEACIDNYCKDHHR